MVVVTAHSYIYTFRNFVFLPSSHGRDQRLEHPIRCNRGLYLNSDLAACIHDKQSRCWLFKLFSQRSEALVCQFPSRHNHTLERPRNRLISSIPQQEGTDLSSMRPCCIQVAQLLCGCTLYSVSVHHLCISFYGISVLHWQSSVPFMTARLLKIRWC